MHYQVQPQEMDQDMIYGKWLGGKLKQITDNKTKQLIKIKIQNLLFEAQFGESVVDSSRQNMPMANTSNFRNPPLSNQPGGNFNPQVQGWGNNPGMFNASGFTNL